MRSVISYGPRRVPVASTAAPASAPTIGASRKLPARSCESRSDSTSARSPGSSPHAESRNRARSSPAWRSSASWNTRRTRSQRSAARSEAGGSGTVDGRARALGLLEPPVEPCARETPVALHRGGRDLQDRGGLRDREASEEPELDDPGVPRVELGEAIEGVVQGEQVELVLPFDRDVVVELHSRPVARALGGGALARVVDEDAAHRLRGRRDELRAAP